MKAAQHIEKARRALASGKLLLSGGFSEEAGRASYLAGFPAALAYIVLTTGAHIKTHKGARGRFAQLAREDERLDPVFTSFLARAYELKDSADYDEVTLVQAADSEMALREAARMVDAVAALMPSG